MLPKNLNDRKYWTYFQDNVAYTNDAGTAVAIGTFVGGKYNLTAPTYADGDPAVLQFTSSGLLKTDATMTVEGDINIGSVELKDATSDTRAVIKSDGTNNALVVTMNALPALATGSNTIGTVNIGTMGALVAGTETIGSVKITDGAETLQIATDGAVVKTKGIMFMGTDGTNSQTVSMNSDGDVNIADGGNVITVDGSGSAGTAATGVVSIQGIASMTAVQVADNSSSLTVDLLSEYADAGAWSDGSSKHLLVGGLYQATPQTVATGTVAPIEIDVNGKIIESNSGSIKTSVEIMDDWDDSNYCNVNLNLAGTDAPTGAGAEANVLRVTIANDSTGLLSVDDNASSLSIDIAGTAPQLDDTDKIAVSLYGKGTNAGDAAVEVDGSGNLQVVGTGTAGTAAGGVLTIQGVASMTPIVVSVPTTLTGGSETVDTVGICQIIGTTLAIKSIYIRAKATNTSFICVGDSNVDESTNQQMILYANDSVTLEIADRATVYIDADVINEGVDYLCVG